MSAPSAHVAVPAFGQTVKAGAPIPRAAATLSRTVTALLAARVVHTQITNFADLPRVTDEPPDKDCVRTHSCGTFGGVVVGDVVLGEGDGLVDGDVVLGDGDGLVEGDELSEGDELGDGLPEGLSDGLALELSPGEGDDDADFEANCRGLDGEALADFEGLADFAGDFVAEADGDADGLRRAAAGWCLAAFL